VRAAAAAGLEAGIRVQLHTRDEFTPGGPSGGQIIGQGGFDVFIDDDALPERGVLATAERRTATLPRPQIRRSIGRRANSSDFSIMTIC